MQAVAVGAIAELLYIGPRRSGVTIQAEVS